jgi:hypothetical protein
MSGASRDISSVSTGAGSNDESGSRIASFAEIVERETRGERHTVLTDRSRKAAMSAPMPAQKLRRLAIVLRTNLRSFCQRIARQGPRLARQLLDHRVEGQLSG